MSQTKTELVRLANEIGARPCNGEEVINILKQNRYKVISWGSKHFTSLFKEESSAIGFCFQVNGNLHKGWVLITVNASDLYDVTLTKNVLRSGYHIKPENCIPTKTDIYFTDLLEVIDKLVVAIP